VSGCVPVCGGCVSFCYTVSREAACRYPVPPATDRRASALMTTAFGGKLGASDAVPSEAAGRRTRGGHRVDQGHRNEHRQDGGPWAGWPHQQAEQRQPSTAPHGGHRDPSRNVPRTIGRASCRRSHHSSHSAAVLFPRCRPPPRVRKTMPRFVTTRRTGRRTGLPAPNPIGGLRLHPTRYTYDDLPAGQDRYRGATSAFAHDSPRFLPPVTGQANGFNPSLSIMASPWSPHPG